MRMLQVHAAEENTYRCCRCGGFNLFHPFQIIAILIALAVLSSLLVGFFHPILCSSDGKHECPVCYCSETCSVELKTGIDGDSGKDATASFPQDERPDSKDSKDSKDSGTCGDFSSRLEKIGRGSNEPSVQIISIGSTSRPDLLEAQRRTLGRYYPLWSVDETLVEACSLECNSSYNGHFHSVPFSGRSDGWWCAQQRPLQAVAKWLQTGEDVDFLYVIDDDAIINPLNLDAFLRQLDPNVPMYAGAIGTSDNGYPFVMGGSGWLISRPVMDKLRGDGNIETSFPIVSECVMKQLNGGEWCKMHSDWAIGECIFNVAHVLASYMPFVYMETRCSGQSIACHHVFQPYLHVMYYQSYVFPSGTNV